jgi:DNA polymerase-3 subunit delta'
MTYLLPMAKAQLAAEWQPVAVMMVQAGANDALINKELEAEIRTLAEKTKPQSTIKKINAIMDARTNLSHNAAPLLTVEALMCVLAR